MTAANAFLRDQFVPAYTQQLAVPAAEPGTAGIPWVGSSLADRLCVQEAHVVANDNTVRYQGKHLQIPPDQHRFHYVKVTVRVHAYPDDLLAVLHGPRCLARYQSKGQVIEPEGVPAGCRSLTWRSGDRSIVAPKPIVRKKGSARG